MHIGIDLGTTFCCMALIDENGIPKVIPNADGMFTTPSVIYFNGKSAYIGNKANQRKIAPNSPIFEWIKRDMGSPIEIPPNFYTDGQKVKPPKPYEINGFKYGPEGMSAIILRYLKKCAILYFKRLNILNESIDEKNFLLDAIITVPAYFGDKERQATKLAGFAAGLNVIGILNEPTAASLTYGYNLQDEKRLMVFDLGGGTFDITILEIKNGEAFIISSEGSHSLGGKDWDEIIQKYIINEYYRKTGKEIPSDLSFELQKKSLDAKLDLTELASTEVALSVDGEDCLIKLFRSAPHKDEFLMENERCFYFDERCSDLLIQLQNLSQIALEKSNFKWNDLDDIILAGGSCKMPMILFLLEKLKGEKIRRDIKGFSYDTAIAIGAAIYGKQKNKVHDIASSSIGIKVKDENSREFIDHLLKKGTRLPFINNERYQAGTKALLEVYEGESNNVDECIWRGRVILDNEYCDVDVSIEENLDGQLRVIAKYPTGKTNFPDGLAELKLQHELYNYEGRAIPLKDRIMSIKY